VQASHGFGPDTSHSHGHDVSHLRARLEVPAFAASRPGVRRHWLLQSLSQRDWQQEVINIVIRLSWLRLYLRFDHAPLAVCLQPPHVLWEFWNAKYSLAYTLRVSYVRFQRLSTCLPCRCAPPESMSKLFLEKQPQTNILNVQQRALR
jgi:hypothetical protein